MRDGHPLSRAVEAAGTGLPVEPLGEVQPGVWLWRASLDLGDASWPAGWLSDEEQARAAAFVTALERDRFIACRAMLRGLLAGAAGVAPGRLRFDVYPGTTKPRLAWPGAPLSFNLSHSADQALFAIAWPPTAIGVDLEKVRADADIDAIAGRYFSARERSSLGAISDRSERLVAFFACWTRKEAVLKGIGVGLGLPLYLFDVPVIGRWPAPVTGRGRAATLVDGWVVHPLDVGPGWAAAISILNGPGDGPGG